jgi:hypothetical protein
MGEGVQEREVKKLEGIRGIEREDVDEVRESWEGMEEEKRHNENELMCVCLSTERGRGRGRGRVHSVRKC